MRTPDVRRAWPRWLIFVALGTIALPLYRAILLAGDRITREGDPLLWPGLGVTVVALLAAVIILRTEAASDWVGWLELGIILAAGIAFRAVFLGAAPTLSGDAYRYVWDAHLVAHGVSPYVHAANDLALAPLRDGVIWPLVNWPDAPTIYPPGAQVFFLLVHAIAPLNMTAMKVALELCDVGTGVVTLLLLRQRRMDLRRVALYWWAPIPILEFAYSAHVDALAVVAVALALLVAGAGWRGARFCAGALLGFAALVKLYPLLLVFALSRRRDWGFYAGLTVTLALLPLPFVALGLGSGGFLTTYFAQRYYDQGIVARALDVVIVNRGAQVALAALGLLALGGLVAWLRSNRRLTPETGVLTLSAGWIVVAPHLFSWYLGALPPFLAMSLRAPQRKSLAWALGWALWIFTLAMPFTYIIFASGHDPALFLLFFAGPAALALAPWLTHWILRLRAPRPSASHVSLTVSPVPQGGEV